MSEADKKKWDAKYSATHPSFRPSEILPTIVEFLPESGTAIDLAGGCGRNSFWLAERGFDVTLADVSRVGLEICQLESERRGLSVSTLLTDLESDPFPYGPWDLALSMLYLDRNVWVAASKHLKPNGLLIVVHPTTKNLERHAKPPRHFLLDPDELQHLVPRLSVIHYREGWLEDGRHDALLVARKEND